MSTQRALPYAFFRIGRCLTILHLFCFWMVSLQALRAEYGGKFSEARKAELAWELMEVLHSEQLTRAKALEEFSSENKVELQYPNRDRVLAAVSEPSLDEFLNSGKVSANRDRILGALVTELQKNQRTLYAAEKKAAATWKKEDHPQPPTVTIGSVDIFGKAVTAGRIGVVLDSSPSMRAEIDRLRTEITRKFAHNYVVEVERCELNADGLRSELARDVLIGKEGGRQFRFSAAPWFFADPPAGMNPFQEKWHSPEEFSRGYGLRGFDHCWPQLVRIRRSPISALLAMSELLEVDTIFWFSDFQDRVDKDFCEVLVATFAEKKIRLYLVSNDERPSKVLRDYAEESGGDYFDKRDIKQ